MTLIPLPEPSSDASSEAALQATIRRELGSLPDVRVWRNNVGSLKDATGRPVRFGLAEGSSDLVAIVAPHGRMVAIECKHPGWTAAKRGGRADHEAKQRKFLDIVRAFGGVAGFATSLEDALALVDEARRPA